MALNLAPGSTTFAGSFSTVEAAVADRVRRAILSGQLPPGTRMLQGELAELMGISITPIRAALRQLAAEGVIRIEPRRAVVVHWPTPEELEEVFELRALLEPASIRKAAKMITPEELARGEALLEQMEAEVSLGGWGILNRDFHALLVEASGASRLTTIILNLLSLATISLRNSGKLSDERIQEANREHRRILAACRERDPVAARAMLVKHLRASRSMTTEPEGS